MEDSELQKRSSELEKDSELQSVLKKLSAVCQLVEDAKAERNCERIAFQDEKEGLFRLLKQALADKAEAEKEAGNVVERVQKEVWVVKLIKYRGVYGRAQGKAPRYPLEIRISRGDQCTSASLVSDAPHS